MVSSIIAALVSGGLAFIGSYFGVKRRIETKKKLSRKDRRMQYKLAAVKKRLEKHQEAYTLYSKLFFNIHDKNKINNIVEKAENWWFENCLYLDDKSRNEFKKAINQTLDFNSEAETDKTNKKIFEQIEKARNLIVEGVELTPGEHEYEKLNISNVNKVEIEDELHR